LILGPVELEGRPDVVAAARESGLPLVEAPPPARLAALIQAAGTYVGNDAGPTHVAAAVGARTIALFGPSDATIWAPRGPRARVVRAPGGDLGALGAAQVLDILAATRRDSTMTRDRL
jgi:ADP-heptose:LPS heptosyltransferase